MSIHQQPCSDGFEDFATIILGAYNTQEIGALYSVAERGFAGVTLGDIVDRISQYGGQNKTYLFFDWESIKWDEAEPNHQPEFGREYMDDQYPPEGWDSA